MKCDISNYIDFLIYNSIIALPTPVGEQPFYFRGYFFYFCRHILKKKYRVSKDARKNNDMTLQVLNKIILVLFEEKKCANERFLFLFRVKKNMTKRMGGNTLHVKWSVSYKS